MSTRLVQSDLAPPPRRSRAHDYTLKPVATRSANHFGRTWLGAVAALALLWPILTWGLINQYTRTDANFIDALYRRKDLAMADAATAPRLVIVGGSDALFGIDAAQLGRRLNLPAVNYATHAGLGVEYLLDRARRALRPGDVVVLSLAYGMWADPKGEFEDIEFAYFTSYDKSYWFHQGLRHGIEGLYAVPLADYGPSVERLVKYLRGRHAHLENMYDVAHLDAAGDLRMAIPGRRNFFEFAALPMPRELPPRATAAVRSFAAWANASHVRLFYTWPNISRPTAYDPASAVPSPALLKLFDQCGIVPIDHPGDGVFPPDWFFDTDKHLNATGRRIRTDELARHLAAAMDRPIPDDAKIGWLLAGPNAGLSDESVRPDVSYRVLSDPADGPAAISPEALAQAVAGGQAILYDDRAVESLLVNAGLTGQLVESTQATLSDWIAARPESILLAVRSNGRPWTATETAGVPDALAGALGGPSPFAMVIGTGRHGEVARSIPAGAVERFDLSKVVPTIAPMQIELQSRPTDEPNARLKNILRINGHELADAWVGLRLVAINPRRSSVTAAAVFNPGVPTVTHRTWKVVPGPPLHWTTADLSAPARSGPFPQLIHLAADGLSIQSPGLIGRRLSVAGVDLRPILANFPSLVVRLTLRGEKDTLCQVGVSTDRPENFESLPDRRFVLCTGDWQTIPLRIVANQATAWSPAESAVVGVQSEINTPPVVLKSIDFAPLPPAPRP